MVKKVIWSPHSIADRIVILDYWYKRIGNKNYSKRLDRFLKKSIRLISKYPFIGRKYKNIQIRFLLKETIRYFIKQPRSMLEFFIYGIVEEIPKI